MQNLKFSVGMQSRKTKKVNFLNLNKKKHFFTNQFYLTQFNFICNQGIKFRSFYLSDCEIGNSGSTIYVITRTTSIMRGSRTFRTK